MKEYIIKADFITEGDELVMPDIVSELIRCKDCKFSILNNGVYSGSETHGTCIAMGATVDGDDYCSWAERRDEE